jgi:hypothetical protein
MLATKLESVPTQDNVQILKEISTSKGYRLVVIHNSISGKFCGYRLTKNQVRCHFEKVVGCGKIRKLLGLDSWKYVGGVPVAIYPESEIAKVIN